MTLASNQHMPMTPNDLFWASAAPVVVDDNPSNLPIGAAMIITRFFLSK
jgi:hypothetical protein